jgi:hypothetical protein
MIIFLTRKFTHYSIHQFMNTPNIYKSFFFLASLTTITASINLIASPAEALILFEQSLGIQETDNFWYENHINRSSTSLLAFNEEQNVKLTRDIGIQESPDNTSTCPVASYSVICNDWDNLNVTKFLDKGMRISSHLIYFAKENLPTGRINLQATVSFSSRIVGFLGDPSFINPINDLFAPNATRTLGSGGTLEGVSLRPNALTPDLVTLLSPNSIQLNFSQSSGIDPLRVFTVEEVPEPLTILGTGLALGMGMIFKRKSLKSETEN